MTWEMDLTAILAVISLICGITTILSAYKAYKAQKNVPNEKRWEDFETWKKDVDRKLDHDNRKIQDFERTISTLDQFQRVLLKAIKGILTTQKTDEYADEIRQIGREIDIFLIEKGL